MLKKIKNLKGVKQLQKTELKNLNGGKLEIGSGSSAWVFCCKDDRHWLIGTVPEHDYQGVRALGDKCEALGGWATVDIF